MKKITSLIARDKEFLASVETAFSQLSAEEKLPIAVSGLSGGAHYAYITEAARRLWEKTHAPVLIIAPGESEREKIRALLNSSGVRAESFLPRELVFHNISASHDNERERLSVLLSILSGNAEAIVTTPEALVSVTAPRELVSRLVTVLTLGTLISPDELTDRLLTLGFARCETVESPGQFAKRGGIVDFFVSADEEPIRVEFFGDEIDRIVSFDVITQRAVEAKEAVKISPAVEVMIRGDVKESLVAEVRSLVRDAKSESARAALGRDLAALESGVTLDSRDKYLGLIYPERETLMSYLRDAGCKSALTVGTNEGEEALRRYYKEISDNESNLLTHGLISERCIGYCVSKEEHTSFLSSVVNVHINSFSAGSGIGKLAGLFGFRTKRCVAYGKNPRMLLEDVDGLIKGGYRVILECENKASLIATKELVENSGYTVSVNEGDDLDLPDTAGVIITLGMVDGFDLIMPKIAVLSM